MPTLLKLCVITVPQVRLMMSELRRYSELILIPDFKDRYKYLRLSSKIGSETFGFDRWVNQKFYRSAEWRRVRDIVIARDNGYDLAHPEHMIPGQIIVHHMNPILVKDIIDVTEYLLNPEFLISTSLDTHNAIHYGDESLLHEEKPVQRYSNDMSPWRTRNA